MRHLLLSILTVLFLSNTYAQLENSSTNDIPKAYFTIGIGINHTGLLSLGVEVPIQENIAAFADAGVGGWGFKLGVGASYYFDQVSKGSALNLAYYYASGARGANVDVTLNDQSVIPVSIRSTGTLNLTYSHHWKIGRKSKFALVGGYAIALSEKENAYNVAISGVSLDDFGKRILNILHPDGPIFGCKFLIGLGGN